MQGKFVFSLALALLCPNVVSGSFPLGYENGETPISRRQSSGGNSTVIINVDENPTSPLNATAWALIYTYPLAIFSSWAGGVLRNYTTNEIFHQRNLASPNDPGVIKPNVDTLYSRVVLDLSEHDIVLTVPEINDGRYWVYPLYDPFGNNQAEIGAVNGNKAGEYLIRRADDVFAVPGYSNDTRYFNSSAYQGVVNLPGSYATMLIRLLLLHNTTEDLNAVHTYQNASKLTPLNRTTTLQVNVNPAPPLQSLALNGFLLGIHTPAQQLEFAARIIAYNQPEIYSARYRVASILAQAGLYGGHYHAPIGVNLTDAAVIANASITADVQAAAHIRSQGNGWLLPHSFIPGQLRHTLRIRSLRCIGRVSAADHPPNALYPGYGSLGFTSVFNLKPSTALLVTFSGKPTLQTTGFWSLSIYGADQYLVVNDSDRFEVGDRTYNLTYEDGEYVYGPSANASRDSPFQILVQPADLRPPTNWTNNWLPAATTFTWILRWYVPDPAMTNGSYVYPQVENITAIV